MSAAVINFANRLQDLIEKAKLLDFLPPLLLRLFLAPLFMVVGLNKFEHFEQTSGWFESLGMPFPDLMVYLAGGAELIGGALLLIGLATRWVSVPLLVTMLVAALTVHAENGWFAVAPSSASSSPARIVAMLGVSSAQESLKNSDEVKARLNAGKSILRRNGDYQWLTEKGNFVMLNGSSGGIELSATYFIMLLVLLMSGGGRFVSVDYWLYRRFRDIREPI